MLTKTGMKKVGILVLSISLLFALSACGSSDNSILTGAPAAESYSVTFTVTDADDNPVEGAEVVLESTTQPVVGGTTNSEGKVTFVELKGEYSYTISSAGNFDAKGNITSADADSLIPVTLVLVDKTAPIVNIISPLDGAQLGDNDVTIEWDITDDNSYTWELYLGGATFPEVIGDQDDPHRYTFDPASLDYFESYQGLVVFRVEAVDEQNNENSDSVVVNIETRADLIPDLRGSSWPFELNSENQIIFHVKNQGNSTAPSSTARVIFYKTDSQVFVNIPTPSLEPGESTNLTPVDIPSGTANPDINFDIIVDFDNDVDEADETNNEEDGIIIG